MMGEQGEASLNKESNFRLFLAKNKKVERQKMYLLLCDQLSLFSKINIQVNNIGLLLSINLNSINTCQSLGPNFEKRKVKGIRIIVA